ncbi:MAG: hypothetical protein R2817_14495 [Flavobacteriales bacterium]
MNIPLLARIARITGTVILLFLVVVLIGAFSGDSSDPPNGPGWTVNTLLQAFLYPVVPIIGLSMAYWRPLSGGLVASAGLVLHAALVPDMLQPVLIPLLLPGLLHLFVGLRSRRSVPA